LSAPSWTARAATTISSSEDLALVVDGVEEIEARV